VASFTVSGRGWFPAAEGEKEQIARKSGPLSERLRRKCQRDARLVRRDQARTTAGALIDQEFQQLEPDGNEIVPPNQDNWVIA
jgi:hypothetical protein